MCVRSNSIEMATQSTPSRRLTFGAKRTLGEALHELWEYRNLLRNLVVRDLKVRYKHSVLGILWSLLNPLMMMIVFTIVFTWFWSNNSVNKFPAFLLTGLLPWNLFRDALMAGSNSIVGKGHLLKKVYFPREVLPISSVLSNTVNFVLALLMLFIVLWFHDIPVTQHVLWLPVILVIQIILMIGFSFFFSTLNVFYRDIGMILEVGLMAGFFLTPIFYPMDFIPKVKTVFDVTLPIHRLWRWFNPMASIIDAYRTVLYGGTMNGVYTPPGPPALDFMFRTTLTALLVLCVGWLMFRHYSGRFGEEV